MSCGCFCSSVFTGGAAKGAFVSLLDSLMNAAGIWPRESPLSTGLRCKCPRFCHGKPFKSVPDVRDRCDHCNLDLTPRDTGDWTTVFVTIVLGELAVGLAIWLETDFKPPFWPHLVACMPTIRIGSIVMIRLFESILIATHYRNLRYIYERGNDEYPRGDAA